MRRSRLLLIAGLAALLLALAGLWQWRAHERDGSAALARGLAALDAGDARTARVELMNAIKGAPRNMEARAAQARALAELGDGPGAQAEVERARALGQPAALTRARSSRLSSTYSKTRPHMRGWSFRAPEGFVDGRRFSAMVLSTGKAARTLAQLAFSRDLWWCRLLYQVGSNKAPRYSRGELKC